jgi:IS30 family transposase
LCLDNGGHCRAEHKGAIVTLVDRTTRLTLMWKISQKTAKKSANAIIKMLWPFRGRIKTITFDNGKEFAYHYLLKRVLRVDVYYAKPYHSWERGTNENTNGLIRQYFPKKLKFDQITNQDVLRVQNKLNSRPRKCLKYNTPAEITYQMLLLKRNRALRS